MMETSSRVVFSLSAEIHIYVLKRLMLKRVFGSPVMDRRLAITATLPADGGGVEVRVQLEEEDGFWLHLSPIWLFQIS